MRKNIINFSKRKVVNLHGEATVSKKEKKVGNILLPINFVIILIVFLLSYINVLPFFIVFIAFIPCMLYLFYLVLKYTVFKKTPAHIETYEVEQIGNEIKINNYKDKWINTENVEENIEENKENDTEE